MIVTREAPTRWNLIAENHLERDGLAWLLGKLQFACGPVDTSDRGLLRRILADLVERCEMCREGPVTKHYFHDDEHGHGGSTCCDACFATLEAEYEAQGGQIESRDTNDAELVRELATRCGALPSCKTTTSSDDVSP